MDTTKPDRPTVPEPAPRRDRREPYLTNAEVERMLDGMRATGQLDPEWWRM